MTKQILKCSRLYLYEVQQRQSKTRNLTIENKMKEYLVSNRMSLVEKQTLFKLKCRIESVKNNYKRMYSNDLTCIFCVKPSSIDSFEHYLETCEYFMTHDKFRTKIKHLSYMDLFGNLDAQIRLVKIWLSIEKHKNVLQNLT